MSWGRIGLLAVGAETQRKQAEPHIMYIERPHTDPHPAWSCRSGDVVRPNGCASHRLMGGRSWVPVKKPPCRKGPAENGPLRMDQPSGRSPNGGPWVL